MKEAVASFCSPSQLRFLFAQILLNIPVTAIELFNDFQEQLSADYLDRFGSAILAVQHCLHDLSYHLASQSAQLIDFGLPNPECRVDEVFLEEVAFFDRREEFSQCAINQERLLLEQQNVVYQEILNTINLVTIAAHVEQTCFFLDGKAGRGKTFTVNVLVNKLRGMGDIVMICGTTALSVTLYERGRTAHSTFGIPVIEVSILPISRIYSV